MPLPMAVTGMYRVKMMRKLIFSISVTFSLLCNAAQTEFILEDSERESIQKIVDSSLRTDNWNDAIADQRLYIYSHSDGDYSVRVVEMTYAPFHKTSDTEHHYEVLCVFEKDVDDDWDCQKQLRRSIYSSSISKWIPLVDGELNESELNEGEAINFINKVSDNKVLLWEEKNVEIEFKDLFNIGLALSYDEKSINLHASHEKLGLLSIEIPRHISGDVTNIIGIAEFFRVCDDFSMQYGVEACAENQ